MGNVMVRSGQPCWISFLRNGIALVLASVLATSTTMARGGCRPRHLIDLPINMGPELPLVFVSAGGRGATLILDTGAERTILSLPAVKRLGLQPYHAYQRTMRGIGGTIASDTVDVSLTASGVPLPNHGILVGSLSLPALGEVEPPDGLLGADILSNFELDLDLPNGLLHLYEKPSCEMDSPEWGQPYATIEANRSLHDHLFFPVILDGTRLAAIIDSGTHDSLIDERAAKKAGLNDNNLKKDPTNMLRGLDAGTVPSRIHYFASLGVGDEILIRQRLGVTALGLNDADVILGVEYLRKHRVWFSYAAHQIFVSRSP